jgi:hypothetical protein
MNVLYIDVRRSLYSIICTAVVFKARIQLFTVIGNAILSYVASQMPEGSFRTRWHRFSIQLKVSKRDKQPEA